MLAVCGREVYAVRVDDEAIRLEAVATLPSTAQCVACATNNTLYYVPREEPTRLCVWRYKETAAAAADAVVGAAYWPYAAHSLLYHRHKVYGAARDLARLMVYDPLCGVMEALVLPRPACGIASAGGSVAVQDDDGCVYVYDMTAGVTHTVTHYTEPGCTQLLGSYRHYAVVACTSQRTDDTRLVQRERQPPLQSPAVAPLSGPPMSSTLYFVNESGVAVQLSKPELPCTPFAMLDDAVAVYTDEETSTLTTTDGQRSRPIQRHVGDALMLCTLPHDADDDVVCMLCLCDVDADDGVTLDCGHRFHLTCTEEWVRPWDAFRQRGERITFTRACCPGGCKRLVRHPCITSSSDIQLLHSAVSTVVTAALAVSEPTRTADDVLVYVCFACGKPFWGGERVCARMLTSEPANVPSELLCDECIRDFWCERHGRLFVVYKCRYCCNPATQRSFATRYLCERCHVRWSGAAEPEPIPCPGVEQCPLRGRHGCGTATHVIGCLACMTVDDDDKLALDKIVVVQQKDVSNEAQAQDV